MNTNKNLLDAQKSMIADMFGESQCESCKWYHGADTCEAFTDGIPTNIVSGSFKHTSIHPNQVTELLYEKEK